MTKARIREIMKQERALLTPKEMMEYSQRITDRLFSLRAYEQCRLLFTYLSMQQEVNTWHLVRRAWKEGKKVYAPRVESTGLEFYEITEGTPLIKSKFGVSEPEINDKSRYNVFQENTKDDSFHISIQSQEEELAPRLMLLPGLAFDSRGNRIGYGAGYYDRYLARFAKDNFIKIALAYDFQLLDQIETTEYDKKADLIITPSRCIDCRNR